MYLDIGKALRLLDEDGIFPYTAHLQPPMYTENLQHPDAMLRLPLPVARSGVPPISPAPDFPDKIHPACHRA